MWSAKLHLRTKFLSQRGHLHPVSGFGSVGDGAFISFSSMTRGPVELRAPQEVVSEEIESAVTVIGDVLEE